MQNCRAAEAEKREHGVHLRKEGVVRAQRAEATPPRPQLECESDTGAWGGPNRHPIALGSGSHTDVDSLALTLPAFGESTDHTRKAQQETLEAL